jgi:hypothetical protein
MLSVLKYIGVGIIFLGCILLLYFYGISTYIGTLTCLLASLLYAVTNLIIEKSSGASIAFKEDGADVALIEALDAAEGIRFYTGTGGTITEKVRISSAGHLLPGSNDSYDLGSTSLVWRNIYTGDLHLSNESKTEGNSVDGTKGNWTLQEGEEHLYIINNKNGKKYKFSLEEIA